MLFDLIDLRLFVTIAEVNNFTLSAERVHLTPTAAKKRIKELEARVGIALINSKSKHLQFTAAGLSFLTHAQQFLREVERLQADMQQYKDELRGDVRILANTTAVTEFMPEILGNYLAQHPHVNVVLEERPNQDIMEGIQQGTADIGIVAGPVHAEGVEVISFSTDRLVLVTALEHPLAGSGRVSFNQTMEYEHVGLHEGSTLQNFLHRIVSDQGQQLKLRIQVRSFEAMCRMVETNVGIAILPLDAALRHKQTMQLSLIELCDSWSVRERSLVVQCMEDLPLYARDLIDFIREETAHSMPIIKQAA